MDWLYYILLLILAILGLFLNIVGLPGLWMMVLATAIYGWSTGWTHAGLWTLVTLVVLALIGELLEFLAGAAGAKSAGGSRRAMWGAILGALLGGFFLSFLVPIPIIGTVVGVCLGAFLGAALTQFTVAKDTLHSFRVGAGAAKGRLYGIVCKSAVGLVMLLVLMIAGCPLIGPAPTPIPAPLAPPTSNPATLPTTAQI